MPGDLGFSHASYPYSRAQQAKLGSELATYVFKLHDPDSFGIARLSDPDSWIQHNLEKNFEREFFGQAGQQPDLTHHFYAPSAPIAMNFIAHYVADRSLSVTALGPLSEDQQALLSSYDTLLQREPGEDFRSFASRVGKRDTQASAVLLSIPDTPSGQGFSQEAFERIVQFCAQHDRLLIVDFSARFSVPELSTWDQYAILERSGVRYMTLEDTSKQWPLVGMAVSTVIADARTFAEICPYWEAVFVHHSPIVFRFLNSLLQQSKKYHEKAPAETT